MKTNILSFLFGITVMLLISATTQTTSFLTVKPATPKSVIAITLSSNSSIKNAVLNYSKLGYVVKTITNRDSYSDITLVMEKY